MKYGSLSLFLVIYTKITDFFKICTCVQAVSWRFPSTLQDLFFCWLSVRLFCSPWILSISVTVVKRQCTSVVQHWLVECSNIYNLIIHPGNQKVSLLFTQKSKHINSYSASHDNWCTATLWNRIMTAQCEGMGEVGSARYEPALLPPCPSIMALSYSNCQRSTHSNIRAWQCKC